MIDLELLYLAGIDPKTGLPLKAQGQSVSQENILKLLRVMDEQDAVNRFIWENQEVELTSQEIERMIYYKGDLIFFWWEDIGKYFLMPYTLNGNIDYYGRYNTVSPVPFYEGTDDKTKERYDQMRVALSSLKLKLVKTVDQVEDLKEDEKKNSCVVIRDYTNQLSQKNIARQTMMDPLLRYISELPMYMRTALMRMTGVSGMRVNDQSAYAEVMAANKQLVNAALTGSFAIPITAPIEMQELGAQGTGQAQEFLMAWQAMDNIRLAFHGLDSGGIFQKKAHMLEDEQALASGNVGLVMQDGLTLRQEFCNRVNSIWPLGIWCEVSEVVAGIDKNMDGEISDEQDEQYPADMIESETEVENVTE